MRFTTHWQAGCSRPPPRRSLRSHPLHLRDCPAVAHCDLHCSRCSRHCLTWNLPNTTIGQRMKYIKYNGVTVPSYNTATSYCVLHQVESRSMRRRGNTNNHTPTRTDHAPHHNLQQYVVNTTHGTQCTP